MACGLNSHLIYVYDSNKLHESSRTSSGGKNPLNWEYIHRLNLSLICLLHSLNTIEYYQEKLNYWKQSLQPKLIGPGLESKAGAEWIERGLFSSRVASARLPLVKWLGLGQFSTWTIFPWALSPLCKAIIKWDTYILCSFDLRSLFKSSSKLTLLFE